MRSFLRSFRFSHCLRFEYLYLLALFNNCVMTKFTHMFLITVPFHMNRWLLRFLIVVLIAIAFSPLNFANLGAYLFKSVFWKHSKYLGFPNFLLYWHNLRYAWGTDFYRMPYTMQGYYLRPPCPSRLDWVSSSHGQ